MTFLSIPHSTHGGQSPFDLLRHPQTTTTLLILYENIREIIKFLAVIRRFPVFEQDFWHMA